MIVEVGEQYADGGIRNRSEGSVFEHIDHAADAGAVGTAGALCPKEGRGFRTIVVADHAHRVAVELIDAAGRTDGYEDLLLTQGTGDANGLRSARKVLTGIVFGEDIAFRLATVEGNVGQLRAIA